MSDEVKVVVLCQVCFVLGALFMYWVSVKADKFAKDITKDLGE